MTLPKHTPWLERKFNFDFPVTHFTFILERLRGTAPRIEELIKGKDEHFLSRKVGGKWSIKEHIGHLMDLEELHEGRIDDFIAGKTGLRAADMSNAKTNIADHNNTDATALLSDFRETRAHFLKRLEQLDEKTLHIPALHPRLQVQMRPVDMAFFVAEHDDHHLVLMRNQM
ncbi:MAG TPA: DinB family protein [Bacteroidia bacterium]